mgnify:CR=1 FL=1
MNIRLFCLIVDPQGRYRVSCREQDLDRIRPREYFGSFDAAYSACRKINGYLAARRLDPLTRTRRDTV